jgi:magnesium transporter
MTGLLLTVDENNDPHLAKITFIRARNKLITVSNGATKGLTSLIKECENCFTNRSDRDDIFAAILDMIVDHTDNILDKLGHDLDQINNLVFQHHQSQKKRRLLRASPRKRNRQLENILTRLGPTRETLVKLRRSVLSFRRMVAFLRDQESTRDLMPKLQAFETDLKSIEEAESDLSATAGFLLDGVVGYIGLLQNTVMNILTLITLLLTPAMVIGAIYGMNFRHMPELDWTYGYPLSLLAIVLSTIGLWFWMRSRGLS